MKDARTSNLTDIVFNYPVVAEVKLPHVDKSKEPLEVAMELQEPTNGS